MFVKFTNPFIQPAFVDHHRHCARCWRGKDGGNLCSCLQGAEVYWKKQIMCSDKNIFRY